MAERIDDNELEVRFSYHAPPSIERQEAHEMVRTHCKNLATMLIGMVPACREISLAVTHLEEVMLWANAALARRS